MQDIPQVTPPTDEQISNRRDWVVTTTGKVVRRDKAKKSDVISDRLDLLATETWPGPYNCFASRDDAYLFRDYIIDICPSAFLQEDKQEQEQQPETEQLNMPRKKIIEQEEFRDMMRENLTKRMEIFWDNWAKLSPRDKCDLYYKMFSYAYSKAPIEKSTDPIDAADRKADRKRKAAAETISQGLADENFEE